jgi:cephalosporin hydroxylase
VNEIEKFKEERSKEIAQQGADADFKSITKQWLEKSAQHRYSYHFEWMGRPIIQYPQDMIAMQEILWRVKPDLIVETGIAHGGSLIYYASILELIGNGTVLGIDIDIRSHNREAIEAHPMFKRIRLIEGSSVSPDVICAVKKEVVGKRVLVVLDSNHTHEHVLAELHAYADLTSLGSYCVVMDTAIEDLELSVERPWGIGDNPKTAVLQFIANNPQFEIDHGIDSQLMISVAPSGYLRRVS